MIRTIETRLIPYTARRIDLPTPDFGFAKAATTSPSDATETPEAAEAVEDVKKSSDSSAKDASESEEAKSSSGPKKRRWNGEHVVAKKDDEIRGHTAFLTFACKFFE